MVDLCRVLECDSPFGLSFKQWNTTAKPKIAIFVSPMPCWQFPIFGYNSHATQPRLTSWIVKEMYISIMTNQGNKSVNLVWFIELFPPTIRSVTMPDYV